MNQEFCKEVFNRVYGPNGTSMRDIPIPFEQFMEELEEIEFTLKHCLWVNGESYSAVHGIHKNGAWIIIAIDEEDGWQDLTYLISDVFGLPECEGMQKYGSPMDIVPELAKMLGMPLAFDYGENSGYRKTDVEEDW